MTDPGNNDGEGSNNIFQESGIWKRRDIFATSALLLPLASLPFFSSFFPFAVELGGGKWKREPAAARDGPVNLALTSSMKQSTESVLLSLLPLSLSTGGGSVRAFLTLRDRVEGVGVVRLLGYTDKAWSDALRFSSDALEFLDAKRDYLTPLFREDDDAMTQIYKETRAEDRIEAVRVGITDLIDAVADKDVRRTYEVQRRVLLALSDVGELLVDKFPYEVPFDGEYADLPRLLGRCRVTFSFTRADRPLGNVTIIADGFAAPITAGNFVDLCQRQFYSGLPVKKVSKRIGAPLSGGFSIAAIESVPIQDKIIETIEETLQGFKEDLFVGIPLATERPMPNASMNNFLTSSQQASFSSDVGIAADDPQIIGTLPILGSWKEGFVDPRTARLRKIPLEVIRRVKVSSSSKGSTSKAMRPFYKFSENLRQKQYCVDPVLSFDMPGLVALNHPDYNPDGGSAEFFVLPPRLINGDRSSIMDGQYAPFGYVVEGFDLLYSGVREGDVLASTEVDDFGMTNLVQPGPKDGGGFSLQKLFPLRSIGDDDDNDELNEE